MKDRDVVNAATRTLGLLEALNRRETASVAQLQESTNLPKATVVRLLHTLVTAGYARKHSRTAGYTLTERVLRLSDGFRHSDLVVDVAREHLDGFTIEHKWLTNIQTYDRGAMRTRYASRDLSPLASDPPTIDRRSPILTTAHGQVYLAFCPDEERKMILAMLKASKNPANAPARASKAVTEMIADVKRKGYALRKATRRDRIIGFAVPVLTVDGVAATVGIRYFASAMRPAEAVSRYLAPMRKLAATIASALAHAKRTHEKAAAPLE